jgi:hypothetical protein
MSEHGVETMKFSVASALCVCGLAALLACGRALVGSDLKSYLEVHTEVNFRRLVKQTETLSFPGLFGAPGESWTGTVTTLRGTFTNLGNETIKRPFRVTITFNDPNGNVLSSWYRSYGQIILKPGAGLTISISDPHAFNSSWRKVEDGMPFPDSLQEMSWHAVFDST